MYAHDRRYVQSTLPMLQMLKCSSLIKQSTQSELNQTCLFSLGGSKAPIIAQQLKRTYYRSETFTMLKLISNTPIHLLYRYNDKQPLAYDYFSYENTFSSSIFYMDYKLNALYLCIMMLRCKNKLNTRGVRSVLYPYLIF